MELKSLKYGTELRTYGIALFQIPFNMHAIVNFSTVNISLQGFFLYVYVQIQHSHTRINIVF